MSPEVPALFLERNREASASLYQPFHGPPKDEYQGDLRALAHDGGRISVRKDPEACLGYLVQTLVLPDVNARHVQRDWSWNDMIVERMRAGRKSAIKSQKRDRGPEDPVEDEIWSLI
mgnify:CR=1 FL=1